MKFAIAMMIFAAPLVASAADSNPDATFFKKAAEGGISEVDAGNLAQTKATTDSVKEFGGMMVKDHTAANDKLKALAASKSVELPTSASMGQMATKAKLEVLSGQTFEKSYIKGQIKAHQDTIALFKKEVATGQDPDVKAFAKATLPTLQTHLKKIQAIAATADLKS